MPSRSQLAILAAVGVGSAVMASVGSLDPIVQLEGGKTVPNWQMSVGSNVVAVHKQNPYKLPFALLSLACFISILPLAKELDEIEKYARIDAEVDLAEYSKMREMEGEKRLEAHELIAEQKATDYYVNAMGGVPQQQAAIDVSATPVAQPLPQAQPAPIQSPTAVQVAATSAVPAQQQAQPVQTFQPAIVIPDGATLIEASTVADINVYPVVMIVATPGNGKTLTTEWVFSQLPGKKVLCSHKAEGYHRKMFDLVFGYNPIEDYSRWVGDQNTITTDDRDFSYIAANQNGYGTLAEGYWGLFAEISNRQKAGPTRASQMVVYRNFYDESSYAYSTAFQNPLNPDLLKWGQNLVSSTNKLVFFDGRTNGNQVFFAAQSDSVDIIGMKGLAAARDEMWFLFPGRAAIAKASQAGKHQLANWLQSRLNQGYAIAIMVKQDVFWQVLNLPKVEELKAWEDSYKVEPVAAQPATQTQQAEIYQLVNEREKAA